MNAWYRHRVRQLAERLRVWFDEWVINPQKDDPFAEAGDWLKGLDTASRQADEVSGGGSIRWMNLTRYLKTRKDKQSRQIVFDGVKLDMEAVWKVRDEFFPRRGISRK